MSLPDEMRRDSEGGPVMPVSVPNFVFVDLSFHRGAAADTHQHSDFMQRDILDSASAGLI